VKVGGNVQGGSGDSSGSIFAANGPLASLTLGGSLIGGSNSETGRIYSFRALGAVKIGGNIEGGSGADSGQIFTFITLKSLTVGGSVIGGSAGGTGRVHSAFAMGPVKIGGNIEGGSGSNTGEISSTTSIASLTIGGSILGGPNSASGNVFCGGPIGAVKIGGNIDGGDVSTATTISSTGAIRAGRLASLLVGGSIIAGIESGGGTLERSGSVITEFDIGSITVKGSLIGNAAQLVTIFAGHQETPKGTTDFAIKRISIGGRVENAWIFGGVDLFTGQGINGNASIGTVTVGGDWIASSMGSGVTTTDGVIGDGDDAVVPGFGGDAIVAKIASITIKGQVVGRVDSNETFGFFAEQIGSFKYNGIKVPLKAGPNNDTFPANAQVVGSSHSSASADGFAVHVFEV
jgi:hypothetical protein